MQPNKEGQSIVKKGSWRIVSDIFALTFVKVIMLSVSLVQTMILSRTLTKMLYGTYSQILLVNISLVPVFSLGLGSAVNYFFNRSQEENVRKRYINTIFFLTVISGIFCGALILIYRDKIGGYFLNDAIPKLLIYVAFRPCIQNLVDLYQNLFISCGYAKIIAGRNLFISIMQTCIVGSVSYFINDIALIMQLLLLLDLLQYVCFVFMFAKRQFVVSIFKADIVIVKEILQYSLPLLLGSLLSIISVNIDKFMVSRMVGTEEYALYANVSKELPFAFIVRSITTVLMPVITKCVNSAEKDKAKQIWICCMKLEYLITGSLCWGAVLLAPEIIEILYSHSYVTKDAIMVFRTYMVVAMIRFESFWMIPLALGRTDIAMKYLVINCVMNTCLNYPMFYIMGMPGPAMATVVSILISIGIYFRIGFKLIDVQISNILKSKKVLLIGLEMLVCGSIVRTVISVIELHFNNAFVNFTFGYMMFVGALWGLNYKSIKITLQTLKEGAN